MGNLKKYLTLKDTTDMTDKECVDYNDKVMEALTKLHKKG